MSRSPLDRHRRELDIPTNPTDEYAVDLHSSIMRKTFASALFLLGAGLLPLLADDDSYILAEIGTLGGKYSFPMDLNDHGDVVGWSSVPGDATFHAFLYSNGAIRDLGTLGGDLSCATAINNQGEITGNAQVSGGTDHAFLFSNGVMEDIGTLGPGTSYGTDINAKGQVVGGYQVSIGEKSISHTFLYSDGVMRDLAPNDSNSSYAVAINAKGDILQDVESPSGLQLYLYDSADTRSFTLIPSTNSNESVSRYYVSASSQSLNDFGQVVGWEQLSDRTSGQAFIFSNGVTRPLNISKTPVTTAKIITNNGQIAGEIGEFMHEESFISKGGTLTKLSDLDIQNAHWKGLRGATAVNNLGQILGTGVNAAGQTHGYLLTPVPNIEIQAKSRISTRRSRILVKGIARGTVFSVRYRVGSQNYRLAAGKARWRFFAHLKLGRNVISISGLGRITNSLPKKVIVQRR